MTPPPAPKAKQWERRYFFDGGLRFECHRCGRCCTGTPGVVRIDDSQVEAISKFLRLPRATFVEKFTCQVGPIWSLRERPGGECVFYEAGCTIYPVRPVQCRTFPFWVKNLRSEAAWREAAASCPGIGQGRLHGRDAILAVVAESPV